MLAEDFGELAAGDENVVDLEKDLRRSRSRGVESGKPAKSRS